MVALHVFEGDLKEAARWVSYRGWSGNETIFEREHA
jgi:hypothetical protein